MSHIGASAFDAGTGQVFKTKKELREAVAQRPAWVILTTTSMHSAVRQISANQIAPGETWDVVGPTPLNRRWYANVELKGNPGKPVVT
jgi:hypothetical protein